MNITTEKHTDVEVTNLGIFYSSIKKSPVLTMDLLKFSTVYLSEVFLTFKDEADIDNLINHLNLLKIVHYEQKRTVLNNEFNNN